MERDVDRRLASVVTEVSEMLVMPRLENLYIHFEVDRPSTLECLSAHHMFPSYKTPASGLRKLEVGASPVYANESGHNNEAPDAYKALVGRFLWEMLDRFPVVETLTVSVPHTTSLLDLGEGEEDGSTTGSRNDERGLASRLGKVRRLRAGECKDLVFEEVVRLVDCVVKGGGRLETIEVPPGVGNVERVKEALRRVADGIHVE